MVDGSLMDDHSMIQCKVRDELGLGLLLSSSFPLWSPGTYLYLESCCRTFTLNPCLSSYYSSVLVMKPITLRPLTQTLHFIRPSLAPQLAASSTRTTTTTTRSSAVVATHSAKVAPANFSRMASSGTAAQAGQSGASFASIGIHNSSINEASGVSLNQQQKLAVGSVLDVSLVPILSTESPSNTFQ